VNLTIEGISVSVDGLEVADLDAIPARLSNLLSQPAATVKNRDAIADAFAFGIQRCPTINPSDLWHHVIYREYARTIRETRGVNDHKQSWVRASGDAFELFLQNYYNERLTVEGVRLTALFSKPERAAALEEMGISQAVGGSKLDLSVRTATKLIGGIHAKVSLAERVTDDVPASAAMMRRGFFSPLVTLDAKSFPPSTNVSDARAYQNRGELGTPEVPSDKRLYVENHGSFSLCVSYNTRTVPSLEMTSSGKRIYTAILGGPPDALEDATRALI